MSMAHLCRQYAAGISVLLFLGLLGFVGTPGAMAATGKRRAIVTTQLSSSSIILGQSVRDKVRVTGSYGTPTGRVDFQVAIDAYPELVNSPHVWKTFHANVKLVNGRATSNLYKPGRAGDYDFRAIYHGDSKYAPARGGGSENLRVRRRSTTETQLAVAEDGLTEAPSAAAAQNLTITLGEYVTDSATVAGVGPIPADYSEIDPPKGVVSFHVSKEGGFDWTSYDSNVGLVNGQATSQIYVPLTAGEYHFRAAYKGDIWHLTSRSGDEEENLFVERAESSTTTELSGTEITLGESVSDTAFVEGLGGDFPSPTGTVYFEVSSDGGLSWSVFDTEELSGGTAGSEAYQPLAAGTYHFRAVYEGDGNYDSSESGSGEEELLVYPTYSETTTYLSFAEELPQVAPKGQASVATLGGDTFASVIMLGESVVDTAVVEGLGWPFPTPTGTVEFQVSVDNVWDWTTYDTQTLADGAATSWRFTPLYVGQYYFRAVYFGDSNYYGSHSGDYDERLIVEDPKSRTTTQLSSELIVLGETVSDTATVLGLGYGFPTPTGTVDFQVSLDGGVTWEEYDVGVPLNGGTAVSETYAPLAAGMYYFRALYNGDSNYSESVSGDWEEPLIVEQAATSTTTLLSATQVVLGGESVTDEATVAGLADPFPLPTGSVEFQLSLDGGGTWFVIGTVGLSNGAATCDPCLPLTAGNYNFRAVYSGDANYLPSQSDFSDELLIVDKADSVTWTFLMDGVWLITLGESVQDLAVVDGLSAPYESPDGTVDFQVSPDGGWSWTTYDAGVSDVGGNFISILYQPTAAGLWLFRAVYSGDSNYNGSTSGDYDEYVLVNPADPLVTTLLSSAQIELGQSVTDTVTVAGPGPGLPEATGFVDFYVSADGGWGWTCYSWGDWLVNGQATSVPYTPMSAGSYLFLAMYYGDWNYYFGQSGTLDEPLTVLPAGSVTTTVLSVGEIVLGDVFSDTITVTGCGGPFPVPTGTVFLEYSANGGPFAPLEPLPLVGGTATSVNWVPNVAGTWRLRAIYSGDSNYQPSQSGDDDEPLTVTQGGSITTTLLSGDTITLGESVTDTATIVRTGGPNIVGCVWASGTVTFEVSFDGGPWTAYDAEPVVSHSATSVPYEPPQAGAYRFRAIYSGDANYTGSQSDDEAEPLTVNPADTITTTQLSTTELAPGESFYDTITVTGLGGSFPTPTGNVTFEISFEGNPFVTGGVFPLVNGTAIMGPMSLGNAGVWRCRALYSGDSNYNPSQSGDDDEMVTADQAPSTTTTELSATSIEVFGSVTDTATVTGPWFSAWPTGTVDFQVSDNDGVSWTTYDAGVALSGAQATSSPYSPAVPGPLLFRAVYSGDSNYLSSQSGDDDEPLEVTRADTTTITLLSAGPVIFVPTFVTDTATVAGAGPAPTGSVLFEYSLDGSASWIPYDAKPLVGGSAISAPILIAQPGLYLFRATYAGDSNYNGSASGNWDEPLIFSEGGPP